MKSSGPRGLRSALACRATRAGFCVTHLEQQRNGNHAHEIRRSLLRSLTIREQGAVSGAKKVEDSLNKKIPDAAEKAEKEMNVAFGRMGSAGEAATHGIEHAFGHLGKMFAAGGIFGAAILEGTHLLVDMGKELLFDSEATAKLAENAIKGKEAYAAMAGEMVKLRIEQDRAGKGSLQDESDFANSGVAPPLAAHLQRQIDVRDKQLRERFGIGTDEYGDPISDEDRQTKLDQLEARNYQQIEANEHHGKNKRFEGQLAAIEANDSLIQEYRQKQGFAYKFAHGPRDAAEHILAQRMVEEDQGRVMDEKAKAEGKKEEAMKRFPKHGETSSHPGGVADYMNQVLNAHFDPAVAAKEQLTALNQIATNTGSGTVTDSPIIATGRKGRK